MVLAFNLLPTFSFSSVFLCVLCGETIYARVIRVLLFFPSTSSLASY